MAVIAQANITLPPEMLAYVDRRAQREDLTRSQWMRKLIRKEMELHPEENN